MKVKLQARQLWEVVHIGDVEYNEDRRALEALYAVVPLDVAATIALRWISGERVHRATLQRLRGEWEGLTFKPGEQVEDFAMWMTNLMGEMARNGDTDLTEECAVEKFLQSMPKRYAQIINSIETLLDFEQVTTKDVTRRLKSV
jgi:hypothetical protein